MEPVEHRPIHDIRKALELLEDKAAAKFAEVNAADKKILMLAFKEFDTVSFREYNGKSAAFIGNLRIHVRRNRIPKYPTPTSLRPPTYVLVAEFWTWKIRRGFLRYSREIVSGEIEVSRRFTRDSEGWSKVVLRNDNLEYALEKQLEFEEQK